MNRLTGELHLEVENRKGKTVANRTYFQGALKVMRPIYHDQTGQPCYYLLNPGGGYVDGDEYVMSVTVHERARLTLTTQSATKIYKTPSKPVSQKTTLILKAGSYLEYLADPLIAYTDAQYVQRNIIEMAKDSTFVYADTVTPGWSAAGRLFDYQTLQLKTEVYMDGELVAMDHLLLNPRTQMLDSVGFMEGYSHIGSMIVISDKMNDELLEELYNLIKQREDSLKAGVSLLPVPGFSLRALANSTQDIDQLLMECRQVINQKWYGITPSNLRKY